MRAAATELAVTQEMLQAAQDAADAAASVTVPLFRSRREMKIEMKDDQSPVTEADKQAELAMRAVVTDTLSSHAVFGEEYGYAPGVSALPAQLCCMTKASSVLSLRARSRRCAARYIYAHSVLRTRLTAVQWGRGDALVLAKLAPWLVCCCTLLRAITTLAHDTTPT